MAILDGNKATNELVEMRNNYSREIDQLAVVDSLLKERCSKLSDINDNSHIGKILSLTVDGMKNVREALHKLLEAREEVEKMIELYQAYLEIDFN